MTSPARSATLAIVLAGVATLVIADQTAPHTRGSLAAWIFTGLLVALVGVTLALPWLRRPATPAGARPGLAACFREALVLGLVGFGGGVAVLAQIENRFVSRRRWIGEEEFLEAAALAQSLPGAVGVNALGFIGLGLGSVATALALVGGFILPSFILLLGFALLYPSLRQVPAIDRVLHFITPAAAGLVAATALMLAGRGALRPWGRRGGWRGLGERAAPVAIALAAFVGVAFLGFGVVEAVLIAGLIGLVRQLSQGFLQALGSPEAHWGNLRRRIGEALQRGSRKGRPWWRGPDDGDVLAVAPIAAWPALVAWPARLAQLGSLAGIFLRAGALTFGGGFVMIPLLEAELVNARHWLSPHVFAQAMALGQVTPGPVVITATFVGYAVAGLAGALLSTIAVFLPSFLMTWAVGRQVERFRSTAAVQGFLQGVQPAVVGLMLAAAVAIARNGITDRAGAIMAAAALFGVWIGRVNPMWVMLGAAAFGLAQAALGFAR
ncbi:MAG TPA: chromate efflux transporter [Candidatus Eisenbacteria bacterium]